MQTHLKTSFSSKKANICSAINFCMRENLNHALVLPIVVLWKEHYKIRIGDMNRGD